MKVLYNGESIEINDKLKDGATSYDIFSDNINLEETIEFDPNVFFDAINVAKISLEKTIDLGVDNNER